MLERIEAHIRRHSLIAPGGEITCLVSGGADSTCLWHALGVLGYRVSDDAPANEVPEYVAKYAGRIAALGWTPESFAADFSVPLRIELSRIHGW